MAQIPDFTGEVFDDNKIFRQELTKVLSMLNKDANAPVETDLGANTVLAWVDDGKTVLPDGYELADGQKGTFDYSNSKIVYIQKVR